MSLQLNATQVIITEVYQSQGNEKNPRGRLYCTITDSTSAMRCTIVGQNEDALKAVALIPVDVRGDLKFITLRDNGGLIVELSNLQVVDKFKLLQKSSAS